MPMDHKPCSLSEKLRVEWLGPYVDDGYLNGLLGVGRSFDDWHLEGMKEVGKPGKLRYQSSSI
jgi:protein phosphatase 2C family protein 2/3